jgi:uncharacterized protein (DUF362 family)
MSKVIVAKHADLNSGARPTMSQYEALLATGLKALVGRKDIAASVRELLPEGPIGIKTNCIARKLNSTPVALTDALVKLLTDSGFDENDVIVWERTNRELEEAGYELNASAFGRRCFGTDTDRVGYGREIYISGDVNSLVSRILTDLVRYNLNVTVLKDHSLAGLSAGMKNMFGTINNPNKYHDNNCDPFAAHVCNLDPIKTKTRLTVIDAVRVQYDGGPGFISQNVDYYYGLILSDDIVAADTIALEVLEHFRKRNNRPPLAKVGRPVKYLTSAEQLGLGVTDRSRIDLSVLTVNKDGGASPGRLL